MKPKSSEKRDRKTRKAEERRRQKEAKKAQQDDSQVRNKGDAGHWAGEKGAF